MTALPAWTDLVARPGGKCDAGILRFPYSHIDENIRYYRTIGGARMAERSTVAFAMTSLDTPSFHGYLDAVAPVGLDTPIVDVGGGDGRNTIPWLERGYRRVIVVDAAGDALIRMRTRIEQQSPEWLGHILFVEGDARDLPLVDGCAGAVLAIESLYYLNEDYTRGLQECARILAPRGRLLLAERDKEGALMMQLLYYGLHAMLRSHREQTVWDGPGATIQSRAFSEPELEAILVENGLEVLSVQGTSLLAMVLGWMHGSGRLEAQDADIAPVRELLTELGKRGRLRRCHVVVAQHAASRE